MIERRVCLTGSSGRGSRGFIGAVVRRFAAVAVVVLVVLGSQLSGAASASAAAPVTTFAQVKAAFAAGEDVTLGADISVSDRSYLTVGSGLSVTLDLHGHALSITNANGGDAAVGVVLGSSLTIEDTVGGGTLVAGGGAYSAGIGGTYDGFADVHNAGSITITGGTITATSVDYGAGIGGSAEGAGGNVTISGGTVTATGGAQGAGIGGGAGANGGSTLITGGTVTATGGAIAAGIGSGYGDGNAAGPISITGGFVTATGGGQSAGIGGGYFSSGGQVVIGADARVVAISGSNASAIGNGLNGPSFGSLDDRGLLTIPAGSTLTVPAAATASNSGTINLRGTLNGAGMVINTGSILLGGTGTVADNGDGISGHLAVTTHNYTLTYDVNGAQSAAPAAQHIYATTLAADAQDVAAAPTRTGSTFTGWFTSATGGVQVTSATDLSGPAASGPSTLPLAAHYTLDSETVTFDTDGGTTVVAQTVSYGSAASRPADPSKAGSTFDAWYATPTGGAPFDFSTPITADTTLYARYLGDQAITFTAPAEAIVGQDHLLTATGGASGNPVTFSTTSTTCTVTGSTVTFSHTGSCTIDADQAGDADYTAAPTVEQVVTVTPAAQMISITSNPPAHPVVGSSYSVVAAGGSSGEPVTATLAPASAAGACTVTTAGMVSLSGLGDCTIDLSQAGDADYLPAAAAQTITVDTIAPGFPGGTDQVLPGGTVGVDYTTGIADYGTPAPVDTVADGALPPGLVLTGDPVLSGVPTTAGTFTFTIDATNRGGAARSTFTVTVAEPVGATTPPVSSTSPAPTSSPTSAPAPTTSPITSAAPTVTTSESTTVSSSSTTSAPVVIDSSPATATSAATLPNPQLATTGPGLPIWPLSAAALLVLFVGAALTTVGRRRQH